MFKTYIDTDIKKAIDLLNENQVVAIPTETVYGLAGNALNEIAVAKIFEAKNRPFFNPLIIHTHSVDEIKKFAEIDEISLELANKFMPGPLTLLLPKKNTVPDIVTAGSSKVAIRIPNNSLTIQLLKQLQYPLAAPSANQFGYVSPVLPEHVLKSLNGKIPYILNGGKCSVGLESTIIEVIEKSIIIHRFGGLEKEIIEAFIGIKTIAAKEINNNKTPETSGQLKSHYATKTPLIQGDVIELLKAYKEKNVAIITFNKIYDSLETKHQFVLSKNNILLEAAQQLFTTMRKLDNLDYDLIIAEVFPNEGLGVAINDRLKKAQFINKD